jgi:hypothetical protein
MTYEHRHPKMIQWMTNTGDVCKVWPGEEMAGVPVWHFQVILNVQAITKSSVPTQDMIYSGMCESQQEGLELCKKKVASWYGKEPTMKTDTIPWDDDENEPLHPSPQADGNIGKELTSKVWNRCGYTCEAVWKPKHHLYAVRITRVGSDSVSSTIAHTLTEAIRKGNECAVQMYHKYDRRFSS